MGLPVDRRDEHHLDLAGAKRHDPGGASLVGHMGRLDAGGHVEVLAGEVREPAHSGGAVVDVVGPGARQRDEVPHVVDGQRIGDRQDEGKGGHERDGLEVPGRIVRHLLEDLRDHVPGIEEGQGIAVGRGMRDRLDADQARGAGLVLDDDRLPESLGELALQDAGHLVGRAARRIGHDQPDRLRRPVLRLRERRGKHCECGERRHARKQSSHLLSPWCPCTREARCVIVAASCRRCVALFLLYRMDQPMIGMARSKVNDCVMGLRRR